jgi:D-alanine transaminase
MGTGSCEENASKQKDSRSEGRRFVSRIAYVNGRYVARAQAAIHIEDRGYQFADGVYEVCEVRGGRLVDQRRHLERLQRSLSELRIALPMPLSALRAVLRETVRRNRIADGLVYLQITRGVARRDHPFPSPAVKPAIVVTASRLDMAKLDAMASEGVAVVTMPDNRWDRVDIKSIALLPNVLAKQAAREQGAREAWLVDREGRVTEGSSSNAWIVTRDGKIVTRSPDRAILRGITRSVVLDKLKAVGATLGLEFEERAFTVEEAYQAREAFLTSATQLVMPVVRIDGRPIGNGAPGLVAAALRHDFHRFAELS